MPTQPPQKTIDDWSAAYAAFNKKEAPPMTYSDGWFRTPGRTGIRESDVLRMTATLRQRLSREAP
jgi:hypothetical protein